MTKDKILSKALKSILLTRDYVGSSLLPAIKGWEWYDVCCAISLEIPDDPWIREFAARIDKCPQCNSDTGLKYPRDGGVFCEDCGWPIEGLNDG